MANDLIEAIGVDAVQGSNGDYFCSDRYWIWEDKVAKPKLEALGYTNITFSDGERDSFGPLSRIVHAFKDNVRTEFWYG